MICVNLFFTSDSNCFSNSEGPCFYSEGWCRKLSISGQPDLQGLRQSGCERQEDRPQHGELRGDSRGQNRSCWREKTWTHTGLFTNPDQFYSERRVLFYCGIKNKKKSFGVWIYLDVLLTQTHRRSAVIRIHLVE